MPARTADSALTVVDHVRDELVDLLQLRSCRFEYGSLLGHPPSLQHDGSVLVGDRTWDADVLGLPGEGVELRMFGNGTYIGRFTMEPVPGTLPSRQARLVAVTGAVTTTDPAPADTATITVQDGDTLDAIAQAQQVAGGWPALYRANQDTIGDNPDLILPGQTLRLL